MSESKAREKYRRSESFLQDVARGLREIFPEGIEFGLLIFTSDDSKYAGYVSSAERDGMIKALRECADNLEARMDVPPGHPIPGADGEAN